MEVAELTGLANLQLELNPFKLSPGLAYAYDYATYIFSTNYSQKSHYPTAHIHGRILGPASAHMFY